MGEHLSTLIELGLAFLQPPVNVRDPNHRAGVDHSKGPPLIVDEDQPLVPVLSFWAADGSSLAGSRSNYAWLRCKTAGVASLGQRP